MPSKPKKKAASSTSTRAMSSAHLDADHTPAIAPEPPKMPKETVRPNTDPSYIHRDRAKRWETTPYIAEWIENGVAYCKTVKGQAEFREWMRHKFYDIDEYNANIDACNRPPTLSQKHRYTSTSGHMKQWGLASYELGVSPEALKFYHMFTSAYDIGAPERMRAPIKRRRGESAAMWNARVFDSLIDGSRMADVDWEELRRIALSEADKIRDTLVAWHTDPATVLMGVWQRKDSTIMTPDEMRSIKAQGPLQGPASLLVQLLSDAWRSRLHLAHVAHAHWSRAAALFEELARRGLTTSTAIERAYKADAGLKWRLLSVTYWSQSYITLYWSLVCQVVVSQDAFKPYVRSFRDEDGNLHMLPEEKTHPEAGSIEAKVQIIFSDMGNPIPAYDTLEEHFAKRPEDKKKFGSFAWDLLGDVAVGVKFNHTMRHSAFGKRLFQTADEVVNLHGADLAEFHSEFHFLNRAQVRNLEPYAGPPMITWSAGAQLCERITAHVIHSWLRAVFDDALPVHELMQFLFFFVSFRKMESEDNNSAVNETDLRASFSDQTLVNVLNSSWHAQDAYLWERAAALGSPERVASTFGLFNPDDLDWLHAVVDSDDLVFGPKVASRTPLCTPAPVAPPPDETYVQTIPVAAPTESLARSGHAVAREMEQAAPKTKEKTRGEPEAAVAATPDAEEEAGPEYPDLLPSVFKLGKKNLNVFRQILGYKEQTAAGEAQQKLGVVRWEQFEKAMKRIGFEIVQTAGSSVRFDPPAKTARPITFHRPHPDAILPPFLLKWIGSRLKRCYGWTASTFEYDPALTDAA